jgi:hypothetical protein
LSYFCCAGLEIEYKEAGDQVALVNATVLAAGVNKNVATELLEHEMDGPALAKAKCSEAEIKAKLLAALFHFTHGAALKLAEKLSAIASTAICVSRMSPSAMHRVQGLRATPRVLSRPQMQFSSPFHHHAMHAAAGIFRSGRRDRCFQRFGGCPHYGAGEDSVKADSLVINGLHRPSLS